MNETLTSIEKDNLVELENTIQRNLATFCEVGFALMQIKENKLYRENFATFEEYCRDKWGITKTHANRLIISARITDNLAPIGVIPLSESVIRPLARIKDPDRQREAYQKALEMAPEGKVTAKHVEEVVNAMKKKITKQSAPRQQSEEGSLSSDDISSVSAATAQPEDIRDDDPQDNQNISSNAMDLANAAINNLELIRDDDPRKEEALALVEEWISSRRQKDEAMAPCVPTQLFN